MDKSARVGTQKIVPIPLNPPIVCSQPYSEFPVVFQRKTDFRGTIPPVFKNFKHINV